jgi:hypothetical protein
MKGQYAELKSSLSVELLQWKAELEESDLP